jgi:hypothetical protein
MQDISFAFSPIRDHAFFEQSQFERLLGNDLLQFLGLPPQFLDLIARGRPGSVPGKPPLARFQKFLRPAVVQALSDPLAAAQFSDAVLAAKPIRAMAESW